VIVPNQHESTLLGGTDCLLEAGVQQVVTTLGARGAEIASRNGVMAVPSHRVQPVDTVGAGDAFTGAMCAMLAEGSTMEQAVRVAAVAGALATTVRGAVPSLPRREVVLRAFESGVT
jgi:ribokinase